MLAYGLNRYEKMICECGKVINQRMSGKCMACRYREKKMISTADLKPKAAIRGNIDVSRLPVPRLPAKKPQRIDQKPSKMELSIMKAEAKAEYGQKRTPNTVRVERIRAAAKRRVFYTPERDAQILKMRADGCTIDEIAAAMKKKPKSIQWRLGELRRKREKNG